MTKFFKEALRGFAFGIPIFIILLIIAYMNGWRFSGFANLLKQFTINQIYSVVLFMVNGYIIDFFLKKHKRNFFKAQNLVQSILSSLGATLFSIAVIRLFIHIFIEGQSITTFLTSETPSNYLVRKVVID